MNKMHYKLFALTFLLTISTIVKSDSTSYIPKYIEGTPEAGGVTGMDPADLRGRPLFRIEHKVKTNDGTVEEALVHRTYEEFQELDQLIRDDLFLPNPDMELPKETEATAESMTAYLSGLYPHSSIRNNVRFTDFLSINWDGKDISFMYDLEGFLEMLLIKRKPHFMPEPPIIGMDAIVSLETPFERYVYFIAFKHPREETPEYLEFFQSYCETTPSWEGPEDASDVIHPDLSAPLTMPEHYNFTYVHFLPGGYLNGHTVRISFLGNSKFTFLDETKLNEFYTKMYVGQIKPEVILDIGTGTGGSAFVLGELFPESQVMGIDLAPAFIRFTRAHKAIRNATNVDFYQANAEDMTFLADNSVDFVNFAYVLHEMPAENARMIVKEIMRVLKPGGVLHGFDVPYKRNSYIRDYFVSSQTWDEDWHVHGTQGPEPYIGEYENDLKLPLYLEKLGFQDVEEIQYSYFESIFTAKKPE